MPAHFGIGHCIPMYGTSSMAISSHKVPEPSMTGTFHLASPGFVLHCRCQHRPKSQFALCGMHVSHACIKYILTCAKSESRTSRRPAKVPR